METDRAAVAEFPGLRRLIELRDGGGWFFLPVQRNGELTLVSGARRWPGGWSDAIAIRAIDDACGMRCDHRGVEVWRREGGMVDVINALVALPPPGR